MDIEYIVSIIDLYSKKDENSNLIINVIKNNNQVTFKITSNEDYNNETILYTSIGIFYNNIKLILDKVKNNMILIDEKLTNNGDLYYYLMVFSNGRKLSFKNFTLNEMNDIRSELLNLSYHTNELLINNNDIEYKSIVVGRTLLSQTGFSGVLGIILTIVVILIILVILFIIYKFVL